MNKQFEEWLTINYPMWLWRIDKIIIDETKIMVPFSMQWGVYLEFFDSVGISISCEFKNEYIIRDDNKGQQWYGIDFESRQEAQQEAIKKAFSLI